jgi:hypothetical protein
MPTQTEEVMRSWSNCTWTDDGNIVMIFEHSSPIFVLRMTPREAESVATMLQQVLKAKP